MVRFLQLGAKTKKVDASAYYVRLLIGLFFGIIQLLSNQVTAQVAIPIPREGFPYCQPFTGNGPFDYTILGGEIRIPGSQGLPENPTPNEILQPFSANPTGSSLQLTPYEYWHSGYAIVDIPFSSQFGIKTSFEYFSYGPIDQRFNADGISFFMFDADQPLSLGYLGGSLAYAPSIDTSDGSILQPGISGGYVGIGFDEWGNFGVGTAGEPIANWDPRIENSITVRGPQSLDYDVYERYVTKPITVSNNPYLPPPPLDLDPTKWFTIDHTGTTRPDNCNTPGYRKVFIELIPSGSGYQIKIDMLVNTTLNGLQLVSFPLINYPFPAPERLKIGFAGSTGYGRNNHEIRNVKVNVSSIDALLLPLVSDQDKVVCTGEDLEFEFPVELQTGDDAFITCIQLFQNSPGAPDNTFPNEPQDCSFDLSNCSRECNLNEPVPVFDGNGKLLGTFYADLEPLDTENFEELRNKATIRFEPAPDFVGEATVYYNVTDNYGLTSQPGQITVVANPYPEKIQDASIENPSCDGQQDGRIYDLIVGDLVNGFEYEWFYKGNSIGQSGATVSPLVNGEATFELIGVNLGTYTLQVWNPSDTQNGGCYEEVEVVVDQENGTPVELEVPDKTICEGEDVSFLPLIDASNNPNNVQASFLWYQNADRTGGALVNNSTVTIGGNPVEVSISSSGELTLSGLKNTGGATSYSFYVEAASQSQSGGNFCPYINDVLTVATVVVNPPLGFTVSHTDDWCSQGVGEIVGTISGANDITYFLLDATDAEIASNTSGVFSGLTVGDYQIYGVSAVLGCSSPVEEITVEGPQEVISITPNSVVNAFCELPNGQIEFSITGGNLPYQSVEINGADTPVTSDGNYIVSGLEAATYTILATDARGCETSISIEVPGDTPSNFTTLGSEVCEGQTGTAEIATQDPSSGTPIFQWYYQDDAGAYQLISDGQTIGNVSYQISPTHQLSVTGLSANSDPYIYYLLVSGDRICDQGYIPTEIKITPGPEMGAPIVTEACFGESNGSIQAQIPGNNYADFEFSITGGNGVFVDYSKNDGLFENLPAGNYELSIRSALGCVTTLEDVKVLEPNEAINLTGFSIERASCDLPNGNIKDIQISGGWGNYSVEWRKGAIDGEILSGNATGISDLFPDTYYLIVTDDKGCLATFDFEVGELSDPVYEIVPPIDVCLGEQVEIRPIHLAPDPNLPPAAFTEVYWYKNSGQSGLISNGPDSSMPEVIYTIDDSDWLNPLLQIDGLPAGTYTYFFFVECTKQEIEVEINVFATPEIELETSLVSCFGGMDGKVSVLSGSLDEYMYSVDSGTPVSLNEFEAMTFAAGNYDLEVITPAGCPQVLTFTIEGPESELAVSPLAGIDPGCGALNGKLEGTVSGGWAPYTIQVIKDGALLQTIDNSDGKLSLNGLASGVYSLAIEDAQGCQIVSEEIELIDGPSQVLVEDLQICEGQSLVFVPSIDPAAPNATFEWYFDIATTQPIASNSAPNTNGVTYEINSQTGELTVSGLPESSTPYSYYVTAVGDDVCPGFIAEAKGMVYGTPSATYTKIDEVCFEDGGTIEVTATGGSGNYTFILDGQISQDNGLFENVPKGIHSVTIQTPETCEVQLDNIEIFGPDSPLQGEITDILSPTCEMANGAVSLSISGGVPGYAVEVFKDGVSQGIETVDPDGNVVVSGIGQGEYVFEIIDDLGCRIPLSEPLNLVEVPTEISVDDQLICEGEDANLTPSVPSNVNSPLFTWYFDEDLNSPIQSGTNNGITYSISSSGELTVSGLPSSEQPYEYYVMVEGVGICGVTPELVQVTVAPYPNLRVSNPSIVCDPEGTVDLTNYIEGYNPEVYDYDIVSPTGNALLGNDLNAVDESGNYIVSTSRKGTECWTAPQRILVRIASEKLVSDFEYHADQGGGVIISNGDIQILENVEFQDLSTGDVLIWEWDFGDGQTSNEQNPIHIYKDKGLYTVTLTTTDSIGCQSVYTIQVEAKDDFLLMVPNAFTPDGNKNQYFRPEHRGIVGIDFYVFNTWGELIYHTDQLEDLGWDGTLNGKQAPNGNYVYKITYETRSGNKLDKSGVFVLIR
ncbi:PKD domain-containing protein [Algoriphagus sp. PAP.12]|uniref:PKD domain-containing protein n=1 Tax=Algoriphagus sp. PAP.12 TaxID=2996678 RepID=UPI00227CA7B7|nr:PKD domain-containing protein [Algoriphagus sp. PAP.12]